MGLKGHKSLRRKIQYIEENLGDEVEDAVRDGAKATATEMQSNVAKGNTVWRGNLYRSISAEKKPGEKMSRYKIVADVPYAAFVEFGTGKLADPTAPMKFQFESPSLGPNMVANITEWVMTKPVFFLNRTEEVAWAIARNIASDGTRPHMFMRPAWWKQKPIMLLRARLAVKKVIRRR